MHTYKVKYCKPLMCSRRSSFIWRGIERHPTGTFVPLSAPCGVRVRHPLVFSGTQNSKTALTRCESRASKRHQQPDKNKESSSRAHAARHILRKEKLLSHTTFTCEYCSARVLKLWIYHAQKMRVINNGFSVPTIESANHMEKQNTRH